MSADFSGEAQVGYIATADSYKVGGYEPTTSKLAPQAEAIILTALGRLADRVVVDVFETFSKHPKKGEGGDD